MSKKGSNRAGTWAIELVDTVEDLVQITLSKMFHDYQTSLQLKSQRDELFKSADHLNAGQYIELSPRPHRNARSILSHLINSDI